MNTRNFITSFRNRTIIFRTKINFSVFVIITSLYIKSQHYRLARILEAHRPPSLVAPICFKHNTIYSNSEVPHCSPASDLTNYQRKVL